MQNQDTSDYAVQFCANGQWQLGYLNQAEKRGNLISIELNHEYILVGFIKEANPLEFRFLGIENLGETGGESIYRTEDISAFKWSTKNLSRIEKLVNWRKSR